MSTQVETLSSVVDSRSVHKPVPETMNKNIFFVGLILAASGLLSPPIALLAGLIFGFDTASFPNREQASGEVSIAGIRRGPGIRYESA